MKVRILGKRTNPFSRGLFSFDEGGLSLGNSSKNGHGANFGNMLTTFNVGDSHLMNPHEGILIGTDENNIPNLVEEGEVIWNGRKNLQGEQTYNPYVFSDRLMPTSFMIKGVSSTGHKRNKDLDNIVNKITLIVRNKENEEGKPGDLDIIDRANDNPTWILKLENFRAYLSNKGITEEERLNAMSEYYQQKLNENKAEEGNELNLSLKLSNEDIAIINEYINLNPETNQEEVEQDQTELLQKQEDSLKDELTKNEELDNRIQQLEELVALLTLLLLMTLEQALEETAPTLSLTINELELPENTIVTLEILEPLALMMASGGLIDMLPDAEKIICLKAILMALKSIENTGSCDDIIDGIKYDKENKIPLSLATRKILLDYLYQMKKQHEDLINNQQQYKDGGQYGLEYKRLSTAGKSLYRTIINGRGNPNLKDTIMTLFSKLPLEDLLILYRLLLNMIKEGGKLYAEGDEMNTEEQLMQEQTIALEAQEQQLLAQDQLLDLKAQLNDLLILLLIQLILELIILNPLVILDLLSMQLVLQLIMELALQITTEEGKLAFLQMMLSFLQLMLLAYQQILQDKTQLQEQDPNIAKLNANIPTAIKLQLIDLLQAQLEALALQLQMQAQVLMSEGGNTYAEDGLVKELQMLELQQEQMQTQQLPLINELDLQILTLILLLALNPTLEAQQLAQLLALQLSPEGLQVLLQMMLIDLLQQGLQLPSEELQLQIINEILDLNFELLRETGKEPTKYNKTEKGGKSFADVVKDISKEYEERPNDPISKRTLDSLLLDLSDALEEIREIKHKELLDNAFKKMNSLELEEFKQSISQLIQEALGLQPQELLSQEQPLELLLQTLLLTLEQIPEDLKLIIDLIILQQGIDPASLSQEEYNEAATLIIYDMLKQQQELSQEQAIDLQMLKQGLTSEGGKFAEGGEANKFGTGGKNNKDKEEIEEDSSIKRMREAKALSDIKDKNVQSDIDTNYINDILKSVELYVKKDSLEDDSLKDEDSKNSTDFMNNDNKIILELKEEKEDESVIVSTKNENIDLQEKQLTDTINNEVKSRKKFKNRTSIQNLSKTIPEKEGELFLSLNGKYVMIKGTDKNYRLIDLEKNKLNNKALEKVGIDLVDLDRIQKMLNEDNYSISNYRMYKARLDDIDLKELTANETGKYNRDKYNLKDKNIFTFNEKDGFRFKKQYLDTNGNIIEGNYILTHENPDAEKYFGKPRISTITTKEDATNRNKEEFGRFYKDDGTFDLKAFSDLHRTIFDEYIDSDKSPLKDYRDKKTYAYLTREEFDGENLNSWKSFLDNKIKTLENKLNKSDKDKQDLFDLKLLKKAIYKGNWEGEGEFKVNGPKKRILTPGDFKETLAYITAKYKEIDARTDLNDKLKADLKKRVSDSMYGRDHAPYLEAYANYLKSEDKNTYNIAQIYDANGNATGLYILWDPEMEADGWSIMGDRYNDLINHNGRIYNVTGIRRTADNNILDFNGKIFSIKNASDIDKLKKLGFNLNKKSSIQFENDPITKYADNIYSLYENNSEDSTDKDKKDKKDKKEPFKFKSNPYEWLLAGMAGLGAGLGLFDNISRVSDLMAITPEKLTYHAYRNNFYNPLVYITPDIIGRRNALDALAANAIRTILNMNISTGAKAASIANILAKHTEAQGKDENLLLALINNERNAILEANWKQLAHNSDLDLQVSEFNTNINNRDAEFLALMKNNNNLTAAQLKYKENRDLDESRSEAIKTLANSFGMLAQNRDNRQAREYMINKGLLSSDGRRIRRPYRGWSFF